MTAAMDINKLPTPTVIEEFSVEQIRNEMLAELPDEYLPLLPSDPGYMLIEIFAYREYKVRRRINSSALATMLGFARKVDLDVKGAEYGVQRLLLVDGNPSANPPIDPVYENDDDYRLRIQEAFEALTIAGSLGAYRFHARSAHPDVLDVDVQSPSHAEVLITVLSRVGNGIPTAELLEIVDSAVNAEEVRPAGDRVTTQAITNVDYSIDARLVLFEGADPALVLPAAIAKANALVAWARKAGRKLPLLAIGAALKVEGVEDVEIVQPASGVNVTRVQSARCTGVSITVAT